ncbi:MAG: hypothetical protein LBB48_06455 [Treponema sp.]|jgi:hypothetical protein|nr:hypothetical protein [Treponema sp.]
MGLFLAGMIHFLRDAPRGDLRARIRYGRENYRRDTMEEIPPPPPAFFRFFLKRI